jgi:hypothetical protein
MHGFNQRTDDGRVADAGLLAAHGNAFETLVLAD